MKSMHSLSLALLAAAALLGAAFIATAAEPTTFEGIGRVQQLQTIDQRIVIDSERYVLPVEVARAATDPDGEPVMLHAGQVAKFHGSISRGAKVIEAIQVLRGARE